MTSTAQRSSPPWILRIVPALDSLRGYTGKDARADLVAGVTVATVAVPQAMAYAMVAGLPPVYGLYTAIVMTAVGALFNASRQLVNGPTNAISIAVLSVLAGIAEPDARVQAAILLAFLVGAIQLGITLLRLGDLERYISHSVIVGFTAGASALLALDQLKNLLGLKAVGDAHAHFLVRFFRTLAESGGVQMETTCDRAGLDRGGRPAAPAEEAPRRAARAGAAVGRDRRGGDHLLAGPGRARRVRGRRDPGPLAVVRGARRSS